jgi:predicted dithiol-disulfide oxidoreductase (DUF899 family)
MEEVSRNEWLEARKALLAEEKELAHAREAVAARRRALPKVRVTKDYRFVGEDGERTLAALFGPHGQLVVYHFMFGPDWTEGCSSCSFWADGYDRMPAHLAARDVAFAAISRGPLERLLAYRDRMGWSFPWLSSAGSDFNFDYGVSFRDDDEERVYNYGRGRFDGTEAPGLSVFQRDPDGAVFHTYSTFARGLDPLNPGYQLLDLVPKGRDEAHLPWSQAWVRRRDRYGDDG